MSGCNALTANNYWSSTEIDASNAWRQNFNTGNQNSNNKTNNNYVRAVRKLRGAMFSLDEIFQAYFDCRSNKRNTHTAVQFEQRLERNLMQLYRDLNEGSYRIGRSVCFVVTHPKYREVWAANFRDRIVHHLVYNSIADRFYRRFIHDSYACIPGRGVLFGAERIYKHMRSATENWQRRAWYLQADLANFFVSIDKGVLEELVLRHVPEPELRRLIVQIIWHDPTPNPVRNSPDYLFDCVPPHKSLFNCGKRRGLPIGNLSSQFFANVYLDALDQYAKRTLKVRWYGRYVDDVVLIGHDPAELNEAFAALSHFAEDHLRVRFHPKKTVRNTVDRGINFCGQILKPYRKYIRSRTARSMKRAAADPERHTDPKRWASRVNSYLGHCRHAATYRLRKQLAIETGARFAPNLTKIIIPRRTPCNS